MTVKARRVSPRDWLADASGAPNGQGSRPVRVLCIKCSFTCMLGRREKWFREQRLIPPSTSCYLLCLFLYLTFLFFSFKYLSCLLFFFWVLLLLQIASAFPTCSIFLYLYKFPLLINISSPLFLLILLFISLSFLLSFSLFHFLQCLLFFLPLPSYNNIIFSSISC